MARAPITVFYAWQSDRPTKTNRNFIRKALDDAAERITNDTTVNPEVLVDADTEGVVGTPPVTETILVKIANADIFVPDLTFVAQTADGKLVPNPNVLIEYGYALKALTFKAMMPVMNTHFGPPKDLPFDMGHVRHPTQYEMEPDVSDGPRRAERDKLSATLESHIRLMIKDIQSRSRTDQRFVPTNPIRPPAFFFQPNDVLVNFGNPGEQPLRFKRNRAIYVRLYPTFADQPQVGRSGAIEVVQRLKPPTQRNDSVGNRNDWGAIAVQPHGDGITSFAQVFSTGELWGASEGPFRGNHEIAIIGVEKDFVAALDNFRLVYERALEIRPPFTIELGATGLKDHRLLYPSEEFSSGAQSVPILEDSLSRSYQIERFDPAEWEAALKDFLTEFWDLVALRRSQVMTDALVQANGVPAR